MRHINILATLLLLILVGVSLAEGAERTIIPTERESLRGVKGIYIILDLKPEVEQVFKMAPLQDMIELQLRRAGITVLTREESFNQSGKSFLYINVNSISNVSPQPDCYPISISMDFCQVVILERNRKIKTVGSTWSRGVVASHTDLVRPHLYGLVGEFIEDYKYVNPK